MITLHYDKTGSLNPKEYAESFEEFIVGTLQQDFTPLRNRTRDAILSQVSNYVTDKSRIEQFENLYDFTVKALETYGENRNSEVIQYYRKYVADTLERYRKLEYESIFLGDSRLQFFKSIYKLIELVILRLENNLIEPAEIPISVLFESDVHDLRVAWDSIKTTYAFENKIERIQIESIIEELATSITSTNEIKNDFEKRIEVLKSILAEPIVESVQLKVYDHPLPIKNYIVLQEHKLFLYILKISLRSYSDGLYFNTRNEIMRREVLKELLHELHATEEKEIKYNPNAKNLELINVPEETIIKVYNELNGKFIQENEEKVFVGLFTNKKFVQKVLWTGSFQELHSFIDLISKKIMHKDIWERTANCFLKKGKILPVSFTAEQVSNHRNKAPIPSHKKEILQRAANYINSTR